MAADIYKLAISEINDPEILYSIQMLHDIVHVGMRNLDDNVVGAVTSFYLAIDSWSQQIEEIPLD